MMSDLYIIKYQHPYNGRILFAVQLGEDESDARKRFLHRCSRHFLNGDTLLLGACKVIIHGRE